MGKDYSDSSKPLNLFYLKFVLSLSTVGSGVMDVDHETKEARHRSELRRLRKRFGLDKLKVKEVNPSLADGYKDRAEERRRTVGSQDHHEKTESASVHL